MSSSELVNYQLQLQQVEAALLTDPNNDELIKLKSDLTEAIALTKSLMGIDDEIEPEDLISQSVTQSDKFKVGDPCMAPWSEDGQFYEAIIEDLTSDGQCNVVFQYLPNGKFKVSEVCLVSLLKPSQSQRKKKDGSNTAGGKKDGKLDRELAKKKREKKLSRLKELEEAREKDKNKWKQFNQKAGKLKGASTLVKHKSIFKSPDSVSGRVGVGTLQNRFSSANPQVNSSSVISRPPTSFAATNKYKSGPANCPTLDSIKNSKQ